MFQGSWFVVLPRFNVLLLISSLSITVNAKIGIKQNEFSASEMALRQMMPRIDSEIPDFGKELNEKRALETIQKNISPAAFKPFYQAYLLWNEGAEENAKAIIGMLSGAIKAESGFSEAYSMRGHAWMMLHDWGKAENDLRTATSLSPGWPTPRTLLGYVKLRRGDVKAAKQDADLALSIAPEYAPAYQLRGSAEWLLADYEAVIEDLSSAIRLESKDYLLYCQRSKGYRERAKFKEAQADIDESLEINPGNTPALMEQASLYWREKDLDKAIKVYDGLIAKYPKEAEFFAMRGSVYLDLKDLQKAMKDYDKCIQLAPKEPRSYFLKVMAYFKMGFDRRAEAELDLVLRKYPNFSDGLILKGELDRDEAKFLKGLELEPNNPDSRFQYARFLMARNDYDLAYQEAQKILEVSPKYSQGYLIECQYFEELGQIQDAHDSCAKAFELNPFLEQMSQILADLKMRVDNLSSVMREPQFPVRKVNERNKDPYMNPMNYKEIAEKIKANYFTPKLEKIVLDDSKSPDVKSLLKQLDSMSWLILGTESERLSFAGGAAVGIRAKKSDDGLIVISPLSNTPASRAGILAGDIILEIDGRPIREMELREAVILLQGKPGSQVNLQIKKGDGRIIDLTLHREKIDLEEVAHRKLTQDGLGYIRILEFNPETHRKIMRVLMDYRKGNCKGLVLDLRNNPGGVLLATTDAAELFLRMGQKIGSIRPIRNKRSVVFQANRNSLILFPIVVVMNHGTGSGGEIFAAALKDNGRATLVGSRTFGLGSVQEVFVLSDGDMLRLTTGYVFRPNGEPIEGKGISPDVELVDDLEFGPNEKVETEFIKKVFDVLRDKIK